MNLTNVPEELHQIKGMQNDLQSFFERTRPTAFRRLQRLEKKKKKRNPIRHTNLAKRHILKGQSGLLRRREVLFGY